MALLAGHVLRREVGPGSGEGERQRRRHRVGPPSGSHGGEVRGDADARDAQAREQDWRGEHVHRKRHGRRRNISGGVGDDRVEQSLSLSLFLTKRNGDGSCVVCAREKRKKRSVTSAKKCERENRSDGNDDDDDEG